ncbi:MAG: succinylglutamate desuccinylase/aspartoacylase family protein [Acidobacteriota bacterium]|nr:succinylglutamate desuccinylase/aspartoacylase family protein [Acidobacteriota bacterium]
MSAGRRQILRVPVTRDLTGDVDIVAHVAAGRHDGPTLLLLSMLHGNEWFSAVVLRELLSRLDPAALRGNVVAIPVANAVAMATGTRCIQDDADEPDANRTFGGPYQWLSNQITRVLADEFMSKADAVIDYHVGDWGATMADVSYVTDYSTPELAGRSKAMALSYGFPVVHALTIFSGLRGPRTSLGHAGERFGIPGIVAEVGGLGWGEPQERRWVQTNVDGTLGVMRHLGMLDGAPVLPGRYLHFFDYFRVGPSVGGYLEPVVQLDRQFTEVAKGEVLATVRHAMTFELLEEIRSPGRGIIFYACRSQMVRPGGWGFGVASLEDPRTAWVESEPRKD